MDKRILEPKQIFTGTYPSFGPFDCEALRRLIDQIDSPKPRVLEIGSWLGAGSTRVLIEALRPRDGTLYCVDTFEGSPSVARHQEIASDFDILATFRHNVSISSGNEIVRTLCMTSEDAATIFTVHSLDMVFIDGDHSFEQTTNDIARWESKVRSQGILCGHDCEARVTEENKQAIMSNLNADAIPAKGTFRLRTPEQ